MTKGNGDEESPTVERTETDDEAPPAVRKDVKSMTDEELQDFVMRLLQNDSGKDEVKEKAPPLEKGPGEEKGPESDDEGDGEDTEGDDGRGRRKAGNRR